MIALNITNGHIIWATPFIQVGTVLNVKLPDTGDFDTSWGSQYVTLKTSNGTKNFVIGHDKNGNLMAMWAGSGKPVWWKNLASLYSNTSTSNKIPNYGANDNTTLYIQDVSASSNTGILAAIDLLTGKLKWKITTSNMKASPIVTNGIIFTANSTNTSKNIMALDKSSGKLLWQFNLGLSVGAGGPSIGQGMLLVPTFSGYVFAFGLNDTISQNAPINNKLAANGLVVSEGIRGNTVDLASNIPVEDPVRTNLQDPVTTNNTSKSTGNINTKETINTNISNTTVPMQDTGAPLVPLALAVCSLIAGLAATKRK